MKNKRKLFIITTISLALIFTLTYFIADRYMMNKKNEKLENTTIAAQNTEKVIDDNMKICLISDDNSNEELSLKELKEKFNLASDLTINKLCSELKKIGYTLDRAEESDLKFKKDDSQTVEPDKYYIGEKEGYLAIYKSDENGKLFIENDSDVYRENKSVQMLPENDVYKINNFELKYDNKEDAEEDLSEFLS
ncbi:hypothetical protein [Clostridium sp. SM-530-WT-3G]|uniref:hypothetical protein n=1 Tax=Clostridium sp. SM-530-WT-3G TaxID=2725303 RepID=UPI00145E1BD6|nr:hypothetical protein [Clostridium sp. SM-530-WT-3G]NME82497.1 hypothetical protein [Clostridium sp. SM-530-WT-3G]